MSVRDATPAADRRRQILDAARELFATRGFDQTSMADIVAAAGVATGTVYRYFAGKDAIILAACEPVAASIDEATSRDSLPTPDEAVEILMRNAANPTTSQFATQVWARAAFSAPLREQLRAQHEQLRDWLAETIAAAEPALAGDALARAELVIYALSGLRERVAAGVPVDLDAARRALRALFS